ncbi:60S ribosomal protein L6 [Anthonomus grandis grandis]|uniref:60S ribosomal protein L6 n=1 Tax=Anthonomus grandis grandis TaxID=2921223 RepID=UPI002165E123|nr:60S ribosomal protein L6 [Anthonomus grandis grandis]XP_050308635.1 60S ribosomal protein L6 [Anthonomus grandis grandis]
MAPAAKKKSNPRNYDLGNGIVRFSRSKVYHKKALYKFVGKKVAAQKKPAKPRVVEKQIGGEKNGGKRFVLVQKRRAVYPTQDKIAKRPAKQLFKNHQRYLRPSITPGTVLILLAGGHKGKRVVFLKQLSSGLLLVTGPFGINACPLRRISQRYVIGTETKIDISGVKIPETINDEYFRRQRQKRAKKEEGDIFQKKKEGYKVSDTRKADQKEVDKQVIAAIKKHADRKLLVGYLASMFGLRSSQYPHRLKF